MVWYEHLSKAGGTSFCMLAGKNMKSKEVRANSNARAGHEKGKIENRK